MSSSLSNAVEPSTISNYIGEAAITMLFGMGYYFVNKIKDKNNNKKVSTSELNGIQSSEQEKEFINLTSLTEYHTKIKENTTKTPVEILAVINKNKFLPTIDTYNLLIINACKNGFFSEARSLKEEIFDMTSAIYPDIKTFNLLMKGLQLELNAVVSEISNNDEKVKTRQLGIEKFDTEWGKFKEEIKNRGLKLISETHNIYMDILLEQKRYQKGLDYFEQHHKSMEFDLYTYTTALRLVKNILSDFNFNNKTADLKYFDKENKNKNKNLSNRKVSDFYEDYNQRINYIKKTVDIKIKETIEKDNKIPKGDSENYFASLMDSFIALKDHEQAKKVFKEYSLKDESSFVSLMKIYTIEKNLDMALSSFLTLKKNRSLENKFPTISGYGSILNACAKLGNMKLAEEILSEMFSHKIYPNSYVYSTVINGYRISGRLDLAIQAYKLAEMDKGNLSIAVVNTILNTCAEEGEFKKLFSIYESAVNEHNVKPDKITFSILIKSYSKHKQLDKLWDLYSDLIKNKIFDEITFNSLLDVFANAEHEKNLYEIYSEMKKNKINISVFTYGVLLKLFVNLANKERSEEIYQEILRKKITPSIVIFQLMIKLYSYLGYSNKVWNVYQSMINDYNLTPDSQLFDSLLRINLKNNLLLNVKLLIKKALQSNVYIENYLVESFFIKLSSSEELTKKMKKSYANEISSEYSSYGKNLTQKCYHLMDEIFHNKYNNKNYHEEEGYNNNNYNKNNNYKNENSDKKNNKFDIEFSKQNSYSKYRYESLDNVYNKGQKDAKNMIGKSIYDC
jgi:pentatricopeptide repeat protein